MNNLIDVFVCKALIETFHRFFLKYNSFRSRYNQSKYTYSYTIILTQSFVI